MGNILNTICMNNKPKYFSFRELISSSTAEAMGIDNTPEWDEITALKMLAMDVLDPIRVLWGHPIIVNSGYRSSQLNAAVGGVFNSQHRCQGMTAAADITTGNKQANILLTDMIIKSDIQYDQLIVEDGGRWLHVSFSLKPRRQVIGINCNPIP